MKIVKLVLVITLTCVIMSAFGQPNTIELTFTAVDNMTYVQFDSIRVIDQTQWGDTVLYWPDSVLSINYVGLIDNSGTQNDFEVFQNYPNPMADQTTISLYIPEKDKVKIILMDILGRVHDESDRDMDPGMHSFRFTPGNGNLYFFSANWRGQSDGIKILSSGVHSGVKGKLEYNGREDYFQQIKEIKVIQDFSFSPGDELLYICYTNQLQSGIIDAPEESHSYIFQFATNVPCPGMPAVEYEGQVYNTIQILSQCWLKENLNAGEMINGINGQSNNGTIEKYCYNNEPDSCTKYGGLYQWNEMMQYTTQSGIQGICPQGWHLPDDDEWKLLEGVVDGQVGIGDPEWEYMSIYRGFDGGHNMKTTYNWYLSGNGSDLYEFAGLPGGCHANDGIFNIVFSNGFWWTSTETIMGGPYFRMLSYGSSGIFRDISYNYDAGFSVRCVNDSAGYSPQPNLYILGDGTPVGWDNMEAIQMDENIDGIYTINILLDGPGWLKFIVVLGQWTPQYGTDENGTSSEGNLVLRPNETVPDPPAIPVPVVAGIYTVTANINQMIYTVEPVKK